MTYSERKANIERVWQIVKTRLPKQYIPVNILVFIDTAYLFKWYTIKHIEPEGRKKWFKRYVRENSESYKESNYMRTKYFRRRPYHRTPNALNINAMATMHEPIIISAANVGERPEHEIAFIILHELGHHFLWFKYYRTKRIKELFKDEMEALRYPIQNSTDKNADAFAIRWLTRLIKEGLIKYPAEV